MGITSCVAPSSNLPVDQAQSIDIGTLEGIKMLHVNGFIQDFRCHVSAEREKDQHVSLELVSPVSPVLNSICQRCLQMLARNAAPLPFGSDPLVRCNINRIRNRIVPDGQAKVSDGTRAILLHQNVLGFQVSVSNARLS